MKKLLLLLLLFLGARCGAAPPEPPLLTLEPFDYASLLEPQIGGIVLQFQNNGTAIYTSGGGLVAINSTNSGFTVSGNVISFSTSGGGGVSSVGLSMPSTFCAVTNSPVTSSGTLTCSYATGQTSNENQVFGINASGTAGPLSITTAMLPTGIPIANVGSSGLSGTSPIAISSAGAISIGSITAIQGTDTSLMSSGTITSGAGNMVCLDANAGLTTASCAHGITWGAAGTTVAITPSGTNFLPLYSFLGALQSSGPATNGWTAPSALTISNLYVHVSSAEGSSATLAVTLQDGTNAESLTCTVGNSATTCSDTASGHAFTPSVGDQLGWKIVQSGTGTSQIIVISFEAQ